MISIIIPTCNRNELLSRCLDSLHFDQQNFKMPYEIIVSDDSKENIAKAILEKSYPFVKWIAGPKRGPAANRNNGANNALYEWLVFIDDDCIPNTDLIQNYYNEIIKNEFQAFEGAIHSDRPRQRFDEESPINMHGGCFWSCNICIKKSLFIKIGGFDEGFPYPAMEDVDFYKRVKAATEVKFLSSALVIHPWRRMKAFTGYRKHLLSHAYFEKKHHQRITLKYRIARFKILISCSLEDFKTLSSCSFRGTKHFIETVYLNFLMVFLK